MRQFVLRHVSTTRLLFLSAGASLAMLGAALIGQYGFSLAPCHLCLLQRYPYAAIAAIGLLAGWFVKSPRLRLLAAALCVVLFAVDAGIASYHAGVEAGIFPGPGGCTTQNGGEMTIEQMRAEIMAAPLVTCDQAMIHIFGLSMAAWNALAAYAFTVFGLFSLYTLRIGQRP